MPPGTEAMPCLGTMTPHPPFPRPLLGSLLDISVNITWVMGSSPRNAGPVAV